MKTNPCPAFDCANYQACQQKRRMRRGRVRTSKAAIIHPLRNEMKSWRIINVRRWCPYEPPSNSTRCSLPTRPRDAAKYKPSRQGSTPGKRGGGLSREGLEPPHSSCGKGVARMGHETRQPGFKSHLLHLQMVGLRYPVCKMGIILGW